VRRVQKSSMGKFASITQLVESQPSKLLVAGSSPAARFTSKIIENLYE